MTNHPFDLTKWHHWLATGFGSGLAPKAPGTVGTLAALPLVYGLSLMPMQWSAIVILLFCLLGIWVSEKTSRDLGVEDHGGIVIDEFAGMAITLWAVPLTIWTLLAGFVLFRFFDIVKPWPVRVFDQHVKGGLGVMADDIVAGILACTLLHGVLLAF